MNSYYENHINYDKICYLRSLKDPHEILDFIKTHNLPLNSYIEQKKNYWVPLIYYFSTRSEFASVVSYLLGRKKQLNFSLGADGPNPEHILFTCHSMYFSELSKLFNKLSIRDTCTQNGIKKKILSCEWRRIRLLEKHNHLNPVDTAKILNDPSLILNMLKSIRDFLLFKFSALEEKEELPDKMAVLEQVMKKLVETIRFILSYGIKLKKDDIQFCIDMYLYEILSLPDVRAIEKDSLKTVEYHEFKDAFTVAVLRPLLNDARYVKTCETLNVEPDKEVYARV